jgi:hypothetical protein
LIGLSGSGSGAGVTAILRRRSAPSYGLVRDGAAFGYRLVESNLWPPRRELGKAS